MASYESGCQGGNKDREEEGASLSWKEATLWGYIVSQDAGLTSLVLAAELRSA